MPLPVIPVAAVIAAAVVGGAATAFGGGRKLKEAKGVQAKASESYEKGLSVFRTVEARVQARAGAYGHRQLRIQVTTLGAWVDWLEANEKKVRRIGRSTVDGVEVAAPDIPTLKATVIETISLLRGTAGAAAGAVAFHQTALWGVTTYAVAGTGAAISGLTGAAATNATLAWLGGGTLAAGGGGIALGSMMLTGIVTAPAALIAGFTLGAQGQRAITKAREIEAGVQIALAEVAVKHDILDQVEVRIGELEDVLDRVNARALASLEVLSSRVFDPELHLAEFQRTALLMRGLGEILSTPIVDADGKPTEQSLRVKERYSE